MASKKPWIPPPCQASTFGKRNDKTALESRRQELPVLEVIALEVAKLENLVASLDNALKKNKNLISPAVQNLTDVEKEHKRLSKVLSNLDNWQGEQKHLLKGVLTEMNQMNSSLALFSGNFKRNEKSQENEISFLRKEHEVLEKRYTKHLTCLKKHLVSQKLEAKELYASVESLRRDLLEKEDNIQGLTNLCYELKASVSEMKSKNEELQATNHQMILNMESVMPVVESASLKKDSNELTEQQVLDPEVGSAKKVQRKVAKLEKSKYECQEKMKKLERKLKRSQDTIANLRAEYEKEKAMWEVNKVPEATREMDTELKKLKEECRAQENQISLLNEVLRSKSKEVEDLCTANEELNRKHASDVKLLRSDLDKALNSEQSLRNQLQHLKSSYAALFSDPSILEGSSSVM